MVGILSKVDFISDECKKVFPISNQFFLGKLDTTGLISRSCLDVSCLDVIPDHYQNMPVKVKGYNVLMSTLGNYSWKYNSKQNI